MTPVLLLGLLSLAARTVRLVEETVGEPCPAVDGDERAALALLGAFALGRSVLREAKRVFPETDRPAASAGSPSPHRSTLRALLR